MIDSRNIQRELYGISRSGDISEMDANEEKPSFSGKLNSDSQRERLRVSASTKTVVFWVLAVLIISLLITSITTLILLLQQQREMAINSKVSSLSESQRDVNWTDMYELLTADTVREALNRTMENALKKQKNLIQEQIEKMVPLPDAGYLLRVGNKALSNMKNSTIQTLKGELNISNQQLRDRIDSLLSHLNDTVLLERLKEELEIDQTHIDMAVHRAVKNMSRSEIALIRGMCQMVYDKKCYWLIKSGPISYKRAEGLCERRGAMAANIYDDGHYKATMTFLRQGMLPMDTVWIGMTTDTQTRKNYLVNGEVSNLTIPWATTYPMFGALNMHLGLKFKYNVTDPDQGFFNADVAATRLGIICEL